MNSSNDGKPIELYWCSLTNSSFDMFLFNPNLVHLTLRSSATAPTTLLPLYHPSNYSQDILISFKLPPNIQQDTELWKCSLISMSLQYIVKLEMNWGNKDRISHPEV